MRALVPALVLALVLAVALAACGPRAVGSPPSNATGARGDVTLYRDRALVLQRVELEVAPAAYATVRLEVAAGVGVEDLYIVERDRFTIREVRELAEPTPGTPPAPRPVEPVADRADADDADDADDAETRDAPAAIAPELPTRIELVIGAPHAGRFAIHVGYLTDRITWDAAYTLTATAARDHAVLRGALAIRNATGLPLRGVRVRIIDAQLGAATRRAAELLASGYVGAAPATTPDAVPRALGTIDLADGETRVELLAGAAPRAMRSVLVYDPIGTALDRNSAAPWREPSLGVQPAASPRVTESFEIRRDAAATEGLPGGPVRLLERRPDGSIALLGASRLFDASTRVAEVDTVPVGTADGVTGKRERREYTYDEDRRRLVEEFVLAIDNRRSRPVEIVVREHLYRGQNWTLAYHSAPIAAKEGPQQVSMRMIVPARGQTKVLYVVVYTW